MKKPTTLWNPLRMSTSKINNSTMMQLQLSLQPIYINTWSRVACGHPSPLNGIPRVKTGVWKNHHISPDTPCRHDQPTPIQLVLGLSRFMVNTAAIVQRLEHRDTWRQGVRDHCCCSWVFRSCSSSRHGEELLRMTKLDKAHKTGSLGEFWHNTTTYSVWNDQETAWPAGPWDLVEKIFSIWIHANGHE